MGDHAAKRGKIWPEVMAPGNTVKLIVQIPCYNEAETLPHVVADIPRRIEGVDTVEILVIDDGSTDGTSDAARRCGVDHVVRHVCNRGLAAAYMTGLDACARLGADLIVNTDGDGQYRGDSIRDLVAPLLRGECEVVVGERPIEEIESFSFFKKKIQRAGSRLVERLSGVRVPDATSGFRAITREVALKLNISSHFTYTLESLIQCGDRQIAVGSVPVATNPPARASRLFRGTAHYLWRSLWSIIRITTWHAPLRLFWSIGGALILAGTAIGGRFLYFFVTGHGGGHVQSLLLAVLLFVVGFQVGLTGLVADMNATNRRTLEEILYRQRRSDAS